MVSQGSNLGKMDLPGLVAALRDYAAGQDRTAQNATSDLDFWHHVAVKDALLEAAYRLDSIHKFIQSGSAAGEADEQLPENE